MRRLTRMVSDQNSTEPRVISSPRSVIAHLPLSTWALCSPKIQAREQTRLPSHFSEQKLQTTNPAAQKLSPVDRPALASHFQGNNRWSTNRVKDAPAGDKSDRISKQWHDRWVKQQLDKSTVLLVQLPIRNPKKPIQTRLIYHVCTQFRTNLTDLLGTSQTANTLLSYTSRTMDASFIHTKLCVTA